MNFNAHGAHFTDIFDDLVGVFHILGQQRSHKLHRIMRLKVGCLISDKGISCRVGLIETIGGKFFHQIKDGFSFFQIQFVFLGPGQEKFLLLGHFLRLFLTHRSTQ